MKTVVHWTVLALWFAFSGAMAGEPSSTRTAVGRGDFPAAVIAVVRARGQPVELVSGNAQLGFRIGIQIDPATGQLRGGVSRQLNGIVEEVNYGGCSG